MACTSLTPVPLAAEESNAQPLTVSPFDTVAPFAGASIAIRASVTVNVTSMGTVIVKSGLVAVTFSVAV